VCRDPNIPFEDLIQLIPGPDFPTAGFIHGRRGIIDAYRTGRGAIQMRARARIVEGDGKRRTAIVVEQLPYQVNKATLVARIAALVHAKKIDGIADLRDESDRDGIRVVVELKRDAIPEVVLNHLFKQTQMQTTFGIILLGVVNNQPKVFSLLELLQHFVDHRKEVVTRRTVYDLARARERAHILEGLVVALDNLDEVIRTIRSSADPTDAKNTLVEVFALSNIQAQAILDMRLQRLTGLEREKIVDEYNQVLADIARFEEILASEILVENIVVDELEKVKNTFVDQRRTEIVDDPTEYRAQRRGGRGKVGMATKAEDEVWRLFVASTHATLMFFTDTGRVFTRKVYELPEVAPNARGRALINLLALDGGERIETLLAVRDFSEQENNFLLFATRLGRVKRTPLADYANIRSNGLRAININEGDDLLSVHVTSGEHHVFMATHQGKAIRFHEGDVRPMGRTAAGVRGINLRAGDWVEEAAVFDVQSEVDILVVTDLGFGKRTPSSEFRLQGRGGFGVTLIRLTQRNGTVVGIRCVSETDQLMLVTEQGIIIRTNVSEIRQVGRATQGVRLIRVDDGDRVVSLAMVADSDDEDNEQANDAEPETQPAG